MANQLDLAVEAGFPEQLLVPIVPITAPLEKFPDRGKCPGYWGQEGWTNLGNWRKGVSKKILNEANEHDCNLGLLLGTKHDKKQYVFIDVDTTGDHNPSSPASLLAKRIQKEALKAVALFLNTTKIWVRLTRPGRAGMLVELPSNVPAGRISTVHLTGPRGVNAGAIQVLATGQQAVIGGVHPWDDGTPIRWILLDTKSNKHGPQAYPPLTSGAIPTAKDRADINDTIDHMLISLQETCGISWHYKRHTTSILTDEKPLTPQEQAPWNARSFVDLFKNMPHDHRIDRDTWVNTMMAAQGCITASLGVSVKDRQAMIEAAVKWSARWDDPAGLGTTVIDEMEIWDRDWSTREVKHLGWQYLVDQASWLGNTNLQIESACQDFTATLQLDTSTSDHVLPIPKEIKSIQSKRRQTKVRFDVKTSEIQIADAIQDAIGKKCAYVTDEKRWIAWNGPEYGWSSPYGEAIVRQEIENQLIYYVETHNESFGNNDSVRAKLTSARAVRDIESILRSRVAIDSTQINLGDLILQTPGGPWDLVTGQPLTGERYENLIAYRDTRITSCSPAPGPTPLFDALLDHLSCGSPGVKEWLWSYMGYAILGQPRLHLIFLLYGPGGNGKTTFVNVQARIGGNYSTPLDRRVIVKSGSNDHPTGLNMAKGKRLWFIAELDPNERWNEAIIRSISGGDPITARGMNQNMSTFKAEGTLTIYTNFIPAFHRIDDAIIRRFRILHSYMKVPPEMFDARIEDKILAQEGPAILFKLIQEGKKVIERGWQLTPTPAAIEYDTKRYFSTQDTFSVWFAAECIAARLDAQYAPLSIDILYARYKAFTEREAATMNQESDSDDPASLLTGGTSYLSLNAFTSALHKCGAVNIGDDGMPLRSPTGRPMIRGIRFRNLAEVVAA